MATERSELVKATVAMMADVICHNNGKWDENVQFVRDIKGMGEKLEFHNSDIAIHHVLAEEPEDCTELGYTVLQTRESMYNLFGIKADVDDVVVLVTFKNFPLCSNGLPFAGAYVCNAEGIKSAWHIPFIGSMKDGCGPAPELAIDIWNRIK